jgi:hypothetical protein
VEEVAASITLARIREMAERLFGNLVKAVVDVKLGLLVVDMDLHVDGEQYLLQRGSVQGDLWGINLHPEDYGTANFVEFDSIINIRPRANNRSRSVEDTAMQSRILSLIESKVIA